MKYTSIFEKLFSLFSLSLTSFLDLGFLCIIIFIGFLVLKKMISKKMGLILSILSNILFLGIIIFNHQSILKSIFDQLITNMFENIYFPSTYTYLFIFLFMNSAIILSFISTRKKSSYQVIHAFFYLLFNFVFALILELICQYKIDIFKKSSLFSNKNLIMMLEFSVILFIFWLLSLFIVYLSNVISDRIIYSREKKGLRQNDSVLKEAVIKEKPVLSKENLAGNPSLINQESNAIYNREEKKEEVYAYHFIPTIPRKPESKPEPKPVFENQQAMFENLYQTKLNATTDTSSFDLSAFIPNKESRNTISYPTISLEEIGGREEEYSRDNKIESTPKEILPQDKDFYTLNDYRIFNKMLKDIREHNHSNSLVIDKDLEYRLITKYSTETYHLFKKMLKSYSN